MSEKLSYSRNDELEVVKTAYYLENNVDELKNDWRNYPRLRPKEPIKPILQDVQPNQPVYPPITPPEIFKNDIPFFKSDIFKKFGIIAIILTFIPVTTIIGIFLDCYVVDKYFKDRKASRNAEKESYINSVKNSEEYINECKQIEKQCQADFEERKKAAKEKYDSEIAEYEKAYNEYETELLPQYESDKDALKVALDSSEEALKELYENFKIIPAQYHNIPALAWIALYMHTSQYDLKNAIERWDTYVMQCQQREQINLAEAQLYVLKEQLRYQENSYWLSTQLIELQEKNNDILSSIGIWQKADMLVKEYRYRKAKKGGK